jgi:hypothetical protein
MDASRPGTDSHEAVPERCVELVNGETMASGTVQGYESARVFGRIGPVGAQNGHLSPDIWTVPGA